MLSGETRSLLSGLLRTEMGTWIMLALLLSHTLAHNHQGAPDLYHVSEGQLFIISCSQAGQRADVYWSRQGQALGLGLDRYQGQNLSLDKGQNLSLYQGLDQAGVEVLQGRLWFQPVQRAHSGVYTCHYRSQSGMEHQEHMELSVSREECPLADERRPLSRGVTGEVPCRFYNYYSLLNISSSMAVRWKKGCGAVHRAGAPVSQSGPSLWLQEVSNEDAGIYTCFIDLSVGGLNHSVAWSVEVTITNSTVYMDPYVLFPRDQVVPVELGGSVKLRCVADLGYSTNGHTLMYWLLNHSDTDDHGLNDSWHTEEDGWRVKGVSTLHIQHVHRGLLNLRIVCRVQTPVGVDQGCVWLTQAEVGPLQRALECFLGPCLLLLLLSVCVYCCRLELLLLYRDLRTRFRTGHQVPCEKLYDAVVTCVIQAPSGLAPSELSHFSQQLLPRHLEDHWGYRLYIQGRDDCPGEALHDALSAVVQSSRRLLLLLCGSDSLGAPPLSQDLQPLCYEQSVGLYDALTHREPRVVLIEICGPVDYSRLPETVQYLRRTQGVLKWRARPGLDCWLSERRFWNRLRYHMPPESSGRSRAGPRVMAQSELVESKSLTSLKVESETSSQAWTECGVTLLDRPEYCS